MVPMLHLVTLGAELRAEGIGLKVVEQGIDTDTAEGCAMFGMLSVLTVISSSKNDQVCELGCGVEDDVLVLAA
jgi:hypothetical protein